MNPAALNTICPDRETSPITNQRASSSTLPTGLWLLLLSRRVEKQQCPSDDHLGDGPAAIPWRQRGPCADSDAFENVRLVIRGLTRSPVGEKHDI